MSKYDLIIVANSPGELSALVKPVVETFSKKLKEARMILVLTPCQYRSGKELEYIRTLPGISETVTPSGYRNWVLFNRPPKIDFKSRGAVLFLGGDLAHAVLVAKKVNYPAFAYLQDRIAWTGFYTKFFVPDEKTFSKFAKNEKIKPKLKMVGNLMVDSVSNLPPWSPDKNVITLLPGSRTWQIEHMTPLYEEIIKHIKIEMPQVSFQLVSSPFVKAFAINGTETIKFEGVSNSELAITIPGTNTARLAALGIPMLVVFPLDNLDVIPLEGLAHYLGKIPYLGSRFKKSLAESLNKKVKFFALPNIMANREIVSEIRGIIDPAAVALKAVFLLKDLDQRQRMSGELKASMGSAGASEKILEEIDEALQKTA